MILSNLIFLWLVAFPLIASPGPATLSLASLGSTYGIRPSLPYLWGVMLGTSGVLFLVATGFTGVILAEPKLAITITVIASLYILYLAYNIAFAPLGSAQSDNIRTPAFYSGFILSLANPKAFAAIGATYSGRVLIEGSLALDTAGKIAAIVVVIIISSSSWLVAGSLLSSVLQNPKQERAINICFACLLLISVGSALFSL